MSGKSMENEVLFFKKIGPARCGTARRSSPSTVRGRSQAYSNYIQPHLPTVCQAGVFVLVTRTPTILLTIFYTNGKEKSYVTPNHSINTN
jgi:hypothetical protein